MTDGFEAAQWAYDTMLPGEHWADDPDEDEEEE